MYKGEVIFLLHKYLYTGCPLKFQLNTKKSYITILTILTNIYTNFWPSIAMFYRTTEAQTCQTDHLRFYLYLFLRNCCSEFYQIFMAVLSHLGLKFAPKN